LGEATAGGFFRLVSFDFNPPPIFIPPAMPGTAFSIGLSPGSLGFTNFLAFITAFYFYILSSFLSPDLSTVVLISAFLVMRAFISSNFLLVPLI